MFFKKDNGIIKQGGKLLCYNKKDIIKFWLRLNLEGQVRVKDLSKDFNVTEDCIRKDLNILEKANKLKRFMVGQPACVQIYIQ